MLFTRSANSRVVFDEMADRAQQGSRDSTKPLARPA
jgi:hypothetical protein